MTEFIGTFGVKYSSEPHPSGHLVHPDGYVTLEAPDANAANRMMHFHYTAAFAFVKSVEDFDPTRYPMGELTRIVMGEDPIEPAVLVTEDGRILLRGRVGALTPGAASTLAEQLQSAARLAVDVVKNRAAETQRLAEAGGPKHVDMW